MIHREPLESVARRAATILFAEIQHVSEPKAERYFQIVDLTFLPLETLSGQTPSESTEVLSCRYSQGLPHERHGTTVSPLVTGSGLELQLKAGDRAALLLAPAPDPAVSASTPLLLLRAEPPSNVAFLRELTGSRAARR